MDMDEDSSVDKLQKQLYQFNGGPKERARRTLHEDGAHDIASNWTTQEDVREQHALDQDPMSEAGAYAGFETTGGVGHPPTPPAVPAFLRDGRGSKEVIASHQKQRMAGRWVRGIFLTSLLFFILSAGVAGYFFFYESNQISCDNMVIDVTGPLTIASGKELTLNVGILNKNPTAVQLADLVVQYPEGTRSPKDSRTSLTTARERVGTINAGERVRTSVNALLFGKEQTEYTIDLAVEYRVDESNAVFECKAPYKIIIATAPVSLSVDGLEELSSGQELVLTATMNSNSEETVHDQRLVVEYPFGFEFVRAEPMPSQGTNVWDVGDVAPGSKRTVKIVGVVNAPTVESRTIKFRLGEKDTEEQKGITTTMQLVEHGFVIAKPFLDLTLLVNDNDSAEVPVKIGDPVRATLLWKNTLPYAVYDVEIEALLNNPLIDQKTVRQGAGYYRTVDDTLIWTGQTTPKLKEVGPGATGRFDFSFMSVPLGSDTSVRDPNLTIGFTVRGRRISDNKEVAQTLVAQSKRTIKFDSQLDVRTTILYATGPFTNTGIHPPVADAETTYTVHWAIANNTSDVSGVKVTGELPINVRWMDTTNPGGSPISYNPTTHTVTWSPGDVPAGTGANLPIREVYFQIGVTPNAFETISDMVMVEDQAVIGVDQHTKSVVELKPRAVRMIEIR
jgi:hypothetical protein